MHRLDSAAGGCLRRRGEEAGSRQAEAPGTDHARALRERPRGRRRLLQAATQEGRVTHVIIL